jgi:hypothetical protein
MAAKYSTFKETEDRDLAIENGDFVLLEDQDAIQQQLGTTLRLNKNDWFLDLDEGLRWTDNDRGILGANELSPENEAEIISRTNNTFGVTQITEFEAGFVTSTDFEIKETVTTEFTEEEPLTVLIAA